MKMTKFCKRLAVFALACACATGLFAGGDLAVVYVDADAAAGGDGSSWAQAFNLPTGAVDRVAAKGTVYVRGGTYLIGASLTINGKEGVSILGGYAGDGAPGTCDPKLHPTVIDAQGQCRVFDVENATNTVIDGFTITGGKQTVANTKYYRQGYTQTVVSRCGGGIFFYKSANCEVRNCTICSNRCEASEGTVEGGGLCAYWGNLTVDNCVFLDNCATNSGSSGVYDVARGGAAVLMGPGTKTFRNCRFIGNFAKAALTGGDTYGGAVYHSGDSIGNSVGVFSNCLFAINRCLSNDGQQSLVGHAINGRGLTVKKCTFVGHNGEAYREEGDTLSAIVATDSVFVENGIDICPLKADASTLETKTRSFSNCLVGKVMIDGAYAFTDCITDCDVDIEPGFVLSSDSSYAALGYRYPSGTALPSWKDLCVDPSAESEGDGTQGSPFKTVTAALAAATDWTKIHLAAGTYSAASNGETFPLAISGKVGLRFIGAAPRASVFDGGGVKTAGLKCFTLRDCRLVTFDNLVIENFWLQTTGRYEYSGVAVYANHSQLKFRDCRFCNNRVYNEGSQTYREAYGCATCFRRSGVTMLRTDIENNLFRGGAMWMNSFRGGGLYGDNGSIVFDNGRLVGNGVDSENVTFRGDALYTHGGAAHANSAQIYIRNSLVVSNNVAERPIVNNAGIYTNGWGSAVSTASLGYAMPAYIRLDTCTLDANKGSNAVYNASGTIMMNDCFLRATDGAFSGTVTPAYCAFDKQYGGFTDGVTGNFKLTKDVSAAFKKPSGDWRLAGESELKNKGTSLFWMVASSTDLEGKNRVVGKIPDVGCYEAGGSGFMILAR